MTNVIENGIPPLIAGIKPPGIMQDIQHHAKKNKYRNRLHDSCPVNCNKDKR
jgi:hypothetical protein